MNWIVLEFIFLDLYITNYFTLDSIYLQDIWGTFILINAFSKLGLEYVLVPWSAEFDDFIIIFNYFITQ